MVLPEIAEGAGAYPVPPCGHAYDCMNRKYDL